MGAGADVRIGAAGAVAALNAGIEPKSASEPLSKPVATTVIMISSSSFESKATPQVMFASG